MLDTMILRPTLVTLSADFPTQKMYLESHDVPRVSSIKLPYLSADKKLEQTAAVPAIKNSGKSRVSFFRDGGVKECCVYDRRLAPNSTTNSRLTSASYGITSSLNEKQLLKLQVKNLQLELLTSERLRKTQLEDIQKDKEDKMATMYKKYKAKKDSTKKLINMRNQMLQKADVVIGELRKENKMLRSKNKKLRQSIADYKHMNCEIEEQIDHYEQESEIARNTIAMCETQKKEWVGLVDLFKERITEINIVLDERSERRISEKKITNKTRETIEAIVDIVQMESEDDELVREIEELSPM
jgi:hypothetical protein